MDLKSKYNTGQRELSTFYIRYELKYWTAIH